MNKKQILKQILIGFLIFLSSQVIAVISTFLFFRLFNNENWGLGAGIILVGVYLLVVIFTTILGLFIYFFRFAKKKRKYFLTSLASILICYLLLPVFWPSVLFYKLNKIRDDFFYPSFIKNRAQPIKNYPLHKTQEQWINVFLKNQDQFQSVAKKFYEQSDYQKIQFQKGINGSPCNKKSVKECNPYGLQLGEYDLYSKGFQIKEENEFVDFLKQYNIPFLYKDSYPAESVNFAAGEFGLCGLKFILDGNIELKENSEYLKVIKIQDNCFYFCQDWN